jgi:hypothetical protein
MTASMFQGEGNYMSAVGEKMKTHLPGLVEANARGRIGALKQGSVGPVLSDLQNMMENERKQHEQAYIYAHGHNDGSAPLGKSSF